MIFIYLFTLNTLTTMPSNSEELDGVELKNHLECLSCMSCWIGFGWITGYVNIVTFVILFSVFTCTTELVVTFVIITLLLNVLTTSLEPCITGGTGHLSRTYPGRFTELETQLKALKMKNTKLYKDVSKHYTINEGLKRNLQIANMKAMQSVDGRLAFKSKSDPKTLEQFLNITNKLQRLLDDKAGQITQDWAIYEREVKVFEQHQDAVSRMHSVAEELNRDMQSQISELNTARVALNTARATLAQEREEFNTTVEEFNTERQKFETTRSGHDQLENIRSEIGMLRSSIRPATTVLPAFPVLKSRDTPLAKLPSMPPPHYNDDWDDDLSL